MRVAFDPEEGGWPAGFNPGVAEFSCSFQGFYLFYLPAKSIRTLASAAPSAMRSALSAMRSAPRPLITT